MDSNFDELLAQQLSLEADNDEDFAPEPDDIMLDEQPFAVCFHPEFAYLSVGLIDGQVLVYEYDNMTGNQGGSRGSIRNGSKNAMDEAEGDDEEENACRERLRLQCHSGSCRSLVYSSDGTYLMSSSSDESIKVIDLDRGSVVRQQRHAHDAAINVLAVNENMVASGDDDGVVKLWDSRAKAPVHSWEENEDFVSALLFVDEEKQLLATDGGGYLAVLDMRKGRLYARSDDQDDELLSMALMRDGKKLLVGTLSGVVSIWSWDKWGDCSDRFVGHPSSVDSMVKIDEHSFFSAGEDGLIRHCNVHPNQIRSVVGDHEGSSVEGMSLSHDRKLLASISLDSTCKFFNVSSVCKETSGKLRRSVADADRGGKEKERAQRDEDDLSSSSSLESSSESMNTSASAPGKVGKKTSGAKPKQAQKARSSGGGKKKNFFSGLK